VRSPDLEERVLHCMEEEHVTNMRRITAIEVVSQNIVVQVLLNSYCILTIFGWFKVLPQLTILEELCSANVFLKNVQLFHIFCLTFCSPMKQDLHETVRASIILMCRQMKTLVLISSHGININLYCVGRYHRRLANRTICFAK
jgi:hypothetical protein